MAALTPSAILHTLQMKRIPWREQGNAEISSPYKRNYARICKVSC